MVRIQIGSTFDYDLKDMREDDLVKQIKGHRDDGVPLCIKVIIKSDNVDIILSTPDCPGVGGGRPPNDHEKQIFKLWEDRKLRTNNFSPGQLIAFLKQIQSLC